jgi:hypothetical protein
MKKSIIILSISTLVLITTSLSLIHAVSQQGSQSGLLTISEKQQPQNQVPAKPALKVVYTCPMHPEVVQDKPGKCPKCGMTLVRKEVVKEVYTCPMHPEVIQDNPGKCPKCGMTLVKKLIYKKDEPKKM